MTLMSKDFIKESISQALKKKKSLNVSFICIGLHLHIC